MNEHTERPRQSKGQKGMPSRPDVSEGYDDIRKVGTA
jgi:hypothetical protein